VRMIPERDAVRGFLRVNPLCTSSVEKPQIRLPSLTNPDMNEELYNSYSFLLDRTARRVMQYAQQKFKESKFNVTVDQWLVMKHLYENGEMKQNALAEILFK